MTAQDYLEALGNGWPRERVPILLGGGGWSWAGLARVLAEQSRPLTEILGILDNCPFAETPAVLQIRQELEAGYRHSAKRGMHESSV